MRLDATTAGPIGVLKQPGLEITALSVPHANIPSLAFKVQTPQGTAVFGSDQTGTNPRFAAFAQDADILVLHLMIGAGETNPLHASPSVVGQVARDAKARRLILSHIGQFDVAAAVAEVTKTYAGSVSVAADLQCLLMQ
jgi:ribonuclease BN (tRNA processing enzyme)